MLGLFSNEDPTLNFGSMNFDEVTQYNERIINLIDTLNSTENHFFNNDANYNESREKNIELTIPQKSINVETVTLETNKNIQVRIPSLFNGFKFIKSIGKGGYSNVALVCKESTNELYAAKIFPFKELKQKDEIRYTTNEINILSILDHPNIIKYYDSFNLKNYNDEEYFIIILEYVEGCSLLDFICDNDFNDMTLRQILYKIAKTVEYLHDNGISHGDIKLENILLDKSLEPKLCDFGFARNCQFSKDIRKCCTLEYAPPEMLKRGPYDTRKADIWSLGITFFAAKTKTWPYSVDYPIQDQILKRKLEIPKRDDLSNLVIKCTQKNPKKRIDIKSLINDKYFQNI